MKKYVYLGNNVNLNHRGYPTSKLYELTIHKDCFYIKVDNKIETKLDLKYLKNFKLLQELVKRNIPKIKIFEETSIADGIDYYICPECTQGGIEDDDEYCKHCGQDLTGDWSD